MIRIVERYAAYLSLSIIIVGGILLGWWELYPYKVTTIQKEDFTVVTKTVRPGEWLIFRGTVCKHIDVPGIIYTRWVDGVIFETSPTPTTLRVGCRGADENVYVRVPNIRAGVYHLVRETHYWITPVHRMLTYTFRTEDFTILPGPPEQESQPVYPYAEPALPFPAPDTSYRFRGSMFGR